ncbi:hypothetical protein RV11_GL002509 [Enterococcus phoeniculicola]|jgi:beta-glucoside operon transcriptional antiterminator|uniref:PRD domain-containing protein n=1 Tax=Enterococcus phoeniculicola ATCC BAA-412 TaxID=1158610 RepID=R3TT43_9ENTE|nr:PRD domain-containing protein [Enterococcus phoeniculicola]EOL44759.1 hypothetical protein UC3_01576 [Enterococcus phoeniculicola ATCC BAA-412]EOT75048.1 hypothetical protein I589_02648 [Enterococcus phoeniculicola ATCC BAA-412]OJG72935.1 hypothetical protein RV11_GL002509 [Enterococcus phoeniculicola]
MISVKKVLNSSVVLVEKEEQELIALGRGIGYGKKPGDFISDEEVDKIFLSIDTMKSAQFFELIDEIPIQYFEMTKSIVTLAEKASLNNLNTNIYLTLSDHLHFAVERYEKGLNVSNRLQWEISNYYPKEYEIGLRAISVLAEAFHCKLPEEEAANIAFHLINAQTDTTVVSNGMEKAKLVGTIISMVRYAVMQPIDTNSVHYSRFVTHVRYFVDRYFSQGLIDEKEDELYRQMWSLYPNAMDIATKVKAYIDKTYDTQIPENEIAYLGVHINRLMNHSSMNS